VSRDLRFIAVVDSIEILNVEELEGVANRTLRISCNGGVRYANRVYVNDFGVNDFTVISDTALLMEVPSVAEDLEVTEMDLVVTSSAVTSTSKVELVFAPTKNVGSVEGIQKLIQQVVKILLSEKASNRFAPAEGGGLLSSLGSGMGDESSARLATAVQEAVTATSEHIIAAQTSSRVSLEERLLSLTMTGLSFNSSTQEVSATLRLITYAGSDFRLPITL